MIQKLKVISYEDASKKLIPPKKHFVDTELLSSAFSYVVSDSYVYVIIEYLVAFEPQKYV